jgi:phosphoenolpyruvate---glycerone phosphotransferase subunit DhaL
MTFAQQYFARLLARIAARKDELNALDAALGDGDHGTTMLRGLPRAAQAEAGMGAKAFMRASGGAAGTLFGLVLVAMERHLVSDADLGAELALAEARICELGQVKPGDKSMVDALSPAVAAFGAGDLDAAIEAARQGCRSTIALEARRGRAQYVEGKGKGHQDPGATSIVVLFEVLRETRENQ